MDNEMRREVMENFWTDFCRRLGHRMDRATEFKGWIIMQCTECKCVTVICPDSDVVGCAPAWRCPGRPGKPIIKRDANA